MQQTFSLKLLRQKDISKQINKQKNRQTNKQTAKSRTDKQTDSLKTNCQYFFTATSLIVRCNSRSLILAVRRLLLLSILQQKNVLGVRVNPLIKNCLTKCPGVQVFWPQNWTEEGPVSIGVVVIDAQGLKI